jgi:hypothetical protein
MIDDDECGAVGGMISKENRSIRRNPALVQLCPPQIPHDLTQATAVGRQRLTVLYPIHNCRCENLKSYITTLFSKLVL